MNDAAGGAVAGGIMLFICLFGVAIWCIIGYSLMVIARKTNTDNGWFGFVPILNYVLMCNIAQKPMWWVVLAFLGPLAIVFMIVMGLGMAEARGKSPAIGIVAGIIPIIGLPLLAMGD